MHVVSALPHMHKFGTNFSAWLTGPGPYDGKKFLNSPGYDPDNGVFTMWDPAIDLSLAEDVSFSCSWRNPLDKELKWGYGDNEMCAVFVYAYPPQNTFSALASDTACLFLSMPE